MATHEDPPNGAAEALLGATKGHKILVSLECGSSLIGKVEEEQLEEPGQYLETSGSRTLEFTASGVLFRLEMQYRENPEGGPHAESLNLHLVEGHDWEIPITDGTTRISRR